MRGDDVNWTAVVVLPEMKTRLKVANLVSAAAVARPAGTFLGIVIPGGRILADGDVAALDRDNARKFLELFREAAVEAFGDGWEGKGA